jgi:hypothetical protein
MAIQNILCLFEFFLQQGMDRCNATVVCVCGHRGGCGACRGGARRTTTPNRGQHSGLDATCACRGRLGTSHSLCSCSWHRGGFLPLCSRAHSAMPSSRADARRPPPSFVVPVTDEVNQPSPLKELSAAQLLDAPRLPREEGCQLRTSHTTA